MFDNAFYSQIKDKLLEQRQKLTELENSNDESSATVALDQTRVGRVSRMDALQRQQMSLAAQRQRQVQLQKITAALKRLDEGDYGLCLHCGEYIAAARLELDPTATLCIQCATKSEQQ